LSSSQSPPPRQEPEQRHTISPAKFSKILVGVDGSEESFKAAQYAMDLAKKNKDAQLIALTVNETPSSFVNIIEQSALKKWREHSKAESETLFNRISTYGLDINSQVHLRAEIIDTDKSAYAAIVDYAEKENVDVIVVGTRGKTGFKRILLGSVASGIVTYATCPVLVVK
jgi:nucleotide-binding universal stress UspA family protein